jgi:hypothetical protein
MFDYIAPKIEGRKPLGLKAMQCIVKPIKRMVKLSSRSRVLLHIVTPPFMVEGVNNRAADTRMLTPWSHLSLYNALLFKQIRKFRPIWQLKWRSSKREGFHLHNWLKLANDLFKRNDLLLLWRACYFWVFIDYRGALALFLVLGASAYSQLKGSSLAVPCN